MFWVLESVVLGAIGGGAGPCRSRVPSSVADVSARRLSPRGRPDAQPACGDVCHRLALAAGVVCGLVPALQSHLRALTASLASDGFAWRTGGTRARGVRLRAVMMACQVAVACLLLVSAGLLARSVAALVTADRGFDPERADRVRNHGGPSVRGSGARARTGAGSHSLLPWGDTRRVRQRSALHYVRRDQLFDAAVANSPGTTFPPQTLTRIVSPDYSTPWGCASWSGRALAHADTVTSRPAVVVNGTFAAQYLGHASRHRVPLPFGSRKDWEVVGVVEDLRQSGLRGSAPVRRFDGPIAAGAVLLLPSVGYQRRGDRLRVRSTLDPAALAPAVRTILREEAPRC